MSLRFTQLRQQNILRCLRWHPGGVNSWSLNDWATALTGEVGEACNILKKIKRHEDNLISNPTSEPITALQQNLAKELADAAIYLDLLAARAGIDLGKAIIDKFNEVSVRYDFPERLA